VNILFVVYRLGYADHIAIAYLSAVAKKLGHNTYFCSLKEHNLHRKIKETNPDIIAYSISSTGFDDLIKLHHQVKQKYRFTSIAGGPQATVASETFKQSGMDAYCLGEGEGAFRDFLIRVSKKESFDDVENLVTINKKNAVRPLIENLDDIPMPDRDLTLANSYLKNTPKKTFYTTRGCLFNCTYCANSFYKQLYRHKGTWFRRFSVERIIKEIEYVRSKYRTNFIKFGDDLFVFKADEWLEEFSEKYSSRINIPFNCYLRIDMIDDNLLKLLKKAGCHSVHLSIDSTSEHVRNNILRRKMKEKNEILIENLKLIKSYGIKTWVNYMVGAPESTAQDDIDTIKFNKKGQVTAPAYSVTTPIKGTTLYKECLEKGYIDSTYKEDTEDRWTGPVIPCFSKKDRNIRYNVFLLGPIISHLPWPLYELAIYMIKTIPPNWLFDKINQLIVNHYLTKTIFKLRQKQNSMKHLNQQQKIIEEIH